MKRCARCHLFYVGPYRDHKLSDEHIQKMRVLREWRKRERRSESK